MHGKEPEKNKKQQSRQLDEILPELSALYKEYHDGFGQTDTAEKPARQQEYRYFDPDSIGRDLHIDRETQQKAEEMIAAHAYRDFRVNVTYAQDLLHRFDSESPFSDSQEKAGTASLSLSYGHWAEIVFSRNSLITVSCSDWGCYPVHSRRDREKEKQLCVHEAAAWLLLQEYLKKTNPGDATNQAGEQLMSVSWRMQTGNREHDFAPVARESLKIEPYLLLEDGRYLYVQFRIGRDRLYKIKHIPELLAHFRDRQQMAFGSTTVLTLDRQYLDEPSSVWLAFMEQCVDEEQIRLDIHRRARLRKGFSYYNYDSYDDGDSIKDRITLYGERLDRFFTLSQNKMMECRQKNVITGKREKVMLSLCEGSLDLQLALTAMTDEQGIYQGVRLQGAFPVLLKGAAYAYKLQDSSFMRIMEEKNTQIDLLETLARDGAIDIRIGINELRRFYRRYLPELRRIAKVQESEEDHALTAAALPPEASLVCFLDTDDGNVICRPCAVYEDVYYSVLDLHEAVHAPVAALRDRESEMELLAFLQGYFDHCDAQLHIMFTPREEEAMYHFLDEGLEQLLSLSEVRSTERFKRLKIKKHFRVNVGISVESGIMDLDIRTTDMERDELLSILEGYRQKKRFVRLRSGAFLKLDNSEQAASLMELMDSLHIRPKDFVKGKMHLPAYRALYMDRMLEETEGIYADRDRSFKQLIKQFKTISDADYELSPSLQDVLRKYQKEGYHWLRTLADNGFGGILADEMGLGKTLQVISVLLAAAEETPPEKRRSSLIICPASLVYNWGEELRRFAPKLRYMLVAGSTAERKVLLSDVHEYDVLVTSYDLLKRDIDQYEGISFQYEIIDEAQYIKNHTTAAAKAVKLIHADSRFALTGTPIENRLSELWSIFDFLMPGFLYEYAAFRREMEQPIVKYEDEQAQIRLKRMVSPFILRRLKKQVLKDLPEKLEEVRYAGMEKEQQILYDAQTVRMKQMLEAEDESAFQKDRMQILAELTRLRQICCDPFLCFDDYQGGSAKREAVTDLIRRAMDEGHRILVFSQFVSMLELLEADLDRLHIPYYQIIGATPKQKRLELVKAFNEGNVPVFFISLKAGGTGLNLTGADTVIHYDPWWNIAAQNQATDRTHRLGQQQVVTVYRMIMKGTVEEKILALQTAKKKLAEDILSGESVSSAVITREDLLEILG